VHRFWLLADIAQGERLPVPVGELDTTLEPQSSPEGKQGSMANTQLQIASCSADLDGDQRDEAIWAMPRAAGGCGISIVSLSDDDPPVVMPHGATLPLTQPCQVPALVSFDLNSDGAQDLLLSSVRMDEAGRELAHSLWVLWNDGRGNFAAERMSRVDEDGDSPLAFTALPAVVVPNEGTIAPSIVYVTERGLQRKVWVEGAQRFESDSHVPALVLTAGHALTSGDFNGDGAVDLALADGNKLMVFLAELGLP
ncbi:MAG TPA: hypothetical protein VMG12_21425, partial [Polyangiaceae bacterium]|nr:hypothetical protein [Polyangiaceae bacterium]